MVPPSLCIPVIFDGPILMETDQKKWALELYDSKIEEIIPGL
jgi:hypothetical protein